MTEGAAMASQPQVTRDTMWKLIPGIMIYNLIGRYVLWFQCRKQGLLLPGWIKLTDIRAIPLVRIPPAGRGDA